MFTYTDTSATWRVGERLTVPWKAVASRWTAWRKRREATSPRRLRPLSLEWLRAREIDAWKHADDR
jgi:hypothetical protein